MPHYNPLPHPSSIILRLPPPQPQNLLSLPPNIALLSHQSPRQKTHLRTNKKHSRVHFQGSAAYSWCKQVTAIPQGPDCLRFPFGSYRSSTGERFHYLASEYPSYTVPNLSPPHFGRIFPPPVSPVSIIFPAPKRHTARSHSQSLQP